MARDSEHGTVRLTGFYQSTTWAERWRDSVMARTLPDAEPSPADVEHVRQRLPPGWSVSTRESGAWVATRDGIVVQAPTAERLVEAVRTAAW